LDTVSFEDFDADQACALEQGDVLVDGESADDA